jgi:acyl-CoA reductase-like NAD-dependent aldehyde dehydrogenase
MAAPVFEQVLIGGEWVRAAHGTYPIVNPATEEPAGHAPACSVEQVRAAARAARDAFERGPWRTMSPAERGARLHEVAERFRRVMGDLVELTIAETGAIRRVAELQQVGAVPLRLARCAELAATLADEPLGPAGSGKGSGLVAREPIGVVACITPFNFPMTSCAGKIGPALACGNTVVVKPSPIDPLGVVELCRIVAEVLPPGVLNLVCGPGPEIGEALVQAPEVDMISFTGSSAVGAQIQQTAGAAMKRTLLELGGKSANVVFADCDRERARAAAMQVWTFHAGQICIAGTRLLIEASLYDELTAQLAAAGPRLTVGDPREAGVVVGPLVSAAQRTRVEGYVAKGVHEGATLACGGKRPAHLARGFYMEPTLFTGVTNDMTIGREEVFGPVLSAMPFRDEE